MLSHGWNNGVDSARYLYQAMFTLLAGMIPGKLGTSIAVGIIWPSLLFPDDDPATAQPVPSTGAAAGRRAGAGLPRPAAERSRRSASCWTSSRRTGPSCSEFHSLASGLVTTPPLAPEDAGQQAAITGDTAAVLGYAAAMSKTAQPTTPQGIPNPFTTLWNGGREVLRSMSYYEMKNRAGVIGRNGLGPMLGKLAAADPGIRIHLMGHSFGARLVSYSLSGLPPAATGANEPGQDPVPDPGRVLPLRVREPGARRPGQRPGRAVGLQRTTSTARCCATFTAADRAVGWWYPAASVLAHQDAEAADDLTYQWGGMGHDGYQQPPRAGSRSRSRRRERRTASSRACSTCSTPTPSSTPISPQFSGAHSDIRHPEVVWPVVDASS